MAGGTKLSIIPQRTKVLYDTYAAIAALTASLKAGDLAFATDTNVLYRWNGAALEAITISSRNGNIADIGDPDKYPESSLYQADDETKLYMVISGAWVFITKIPPDTIITASDNLHFSNDAQKTTASDSYVKVKEIMIGTPLVACRVKFDLGSTGPVNGYGRVYKNGVAIGIEQTQVAYATKSQDFANFMANDLIQIYAHRLGADTAKVKNFRLYYDETLVPPSNHTSQDP